MRLPEPDEQGWGGARRILCVRLDSIGDVLMTTPAIRAVQEAGGERHVTLLTSPAGAAVAALVPEIDAVIAYEAPWMKAGAGHPAADDLAMIERLRAGRFDAAIIFTVFSQNPLPAALLCRLAGIPRVLAHCRERAYRLLSDQVEETEPASGIRHEVQRQLDLVATLGWRPSSERLSLSPSPADAEVAARLVAALRLDAGPWAVVHPGASAASRRWPAASFGAALRRLAGEPGWRFVVTGDAAEQDLAAEVVAASGTAAANLAGRLSLGELAALIGAAPLLIANNSGPAHIAAAVGTSVVTLYALTNPQHTPWFGRGNTPARRHTQGGNDGIYNAPAQARVLSHDVPCRWCCKSICPERHHACLRGVSADAVVAAALELAPGAARAAV